MRTVRDPDCLLQEGLAAIRTQYQLPAAFPTEVEAEVAEAVRRGIDGHVDRTALPFVTLDPAGTSGELVDELTDADFQVPTTVARFGDSLFLPNARFGTPPTPDTDYSVVRIAR